MKSSNRNFFEYEGSFALLRSILKSPRMIVLLVMIWSSFDICLLKNSLSVWLVGLNGRYRLMILVVCLVPRSSMIRWLFESSRSDLLLYFTLLEMYVATLFVDVDFSVSRL